MNTNNFNQIRWHFFYNEVEKRMFQPIDQTTDDWLLVLEHKPMCERALIKIQTKIFMALINDKKLIKTDIKALA